MFPTAAVGRRQETGRTVKVSRARPRWLRWLGQPFAPLAQTLRGYRRADLPEDMLAGLTVAVVDLPQSMAFALVAGVPPIYGLYTAIVVLASSASLFTSSPFLSVGPTNTQSLLVAAVVSRLTADPTCTCSSCSGLTLLKGLRAAHLRRRAHGPAGALRQPQRDGPLHRGRRRAGDRRAVARVARAACRRGRALPAGRAGRGAAHRPAPGRGQPALARPRPGRARGRAGRGAAQPQRAWSVTGGGWLGAVGCGWRAGPTPTQSWSGRCRAACPRRSSRSSPARNTEALLLGRGRDRPARHAGIGDDRQGDRRARGSGDRRRPGVLRPGHLQPDRRVLPVHAGLGQLLAHRAAAPRRRAHAPGRGFLRGLQRADLPLAGAACAPHPAVLAGGHPADRGCGVWSTCGRSRASRAPAVPTRW